MKNILSHAHRQVLEEFAWSNVVLAFDFDGTLAPIVDDPKQAFMRSDTRELLAQAARLYPTIVISGRAQDDALRRLRGVGVYAVVGNHGLEPWRGNERVIETSRRWLQVLERKLASFKGVHIEDKIFSLAVHYRHSREKKKARAAVLAAATGLEGVRIIGGKQVVNILPEGAPHKGIALERERDRLRCDTAIYVGDDETDEDVFALDQPGRLLTVRIGAKRSSAAAYYISRQQDMDDLLRSMISLRREQRERAAK